MATVTQLLDRGSMVTGMRRLGEERDMALFALNNAYLRAVSDADVGDSQVSGAFGSAADVYAFASILSGSPAPLKLTYVGIETGGGTSTVEQVSMQELMDMRMTSEALGYPIAYAINGFNGISFYPNPAATDRFVIRGAFQPKELVESAPTVTQETTPTSIPVLFHWDVLLPGMVMEMMDKDARNDNVNFWAQRYERGIARLQQYAGDMGGNANRAYVGYDNRSPYYPDARNR